ncbi:MAG: hypothetical protein ACYCW6_14600 [Candidatus Xenobia bacterium]
MDEPILHALMRPGQVPRWCPSHQTRVCARCAGPACPACGIEMAGGVVCRRCVMAERDVLLAARARLTAREVPWLAGLAATAVAAWLWERVAVVLGLNSLLVGLAMAWIIALSLLAANEQRRGRVVQTAAAGLTLVAGVLGVLLQKHSLLVLAMDHGASAPLGPLAAWLASMQAVPQVHPLVWLTLLLSPAFAWRLLLLPGAPAERPLEPVAVPEPARQEAVTATA